MTPLTPVLTDGLLKILDEHAIVALTGTNGCLLYVNDLFCKMTGYAPEELIGQPDRMLRGGRQSQAFFDELLAKVEGGEVWQGEICGICRDGSPFWTQSTVKMLSGHGTEPAVFVSVHTDITAQKRSRERLELLEACIARTNDVVVITEAEPINMPGPRIVYVNDTFEKLTGYSREEAIGRTPRMLQGPNSDRVTLNRIRESLRRWKPVRAEVLNYTKDRKEFWAELDISPIADSTGWFTHWVAIQRDITERKRAEQQAHKLAFFDHLTNLPNRRLVFEKLSQAIPEAVSSGMQGALLLIDVDNFKNLNDTLGHDAGDSLLKMLASRLVSGVEGVTVIGRVGGDEFAILLERLSQDSTQAALLAEAAAKKAFKAINGTYPVGEKSHRLTSSIGISLFGSGADSSDDLFKQADLALYAAKSAGRDQARFFDPEMQRLIETRVSIQQGLNGALERHEMSLFYQPQVGQAGEFVGAEALLRWTSPDFGELLPGKFIPAAEESRIIIPLGLWVLDSACKQLKCWEADLATRDLVLSINVSAVQFNDASFVDDVRQAVLRHRIRPERLMLELTESMLVQNVAKTIEKIRTLSEFGIKTALDDFGTGYSSLQYLKQLPLSQLKIDQSFVRGMTAQHKDKSIVHSIIVLARSLGMGVLAEGVESEQQFNLLLEEGCSQFQGYFFGRPMPVGQFEAAIRENALRRPLHAS